MSKFLVASLLLGVSALPASASTLDCTTTPGICSTTIDAVIDDTASNANQSVNSSGYAVPHTFTFTVPQFNPSQGILMDALYDLTGEMTGWIKVTNNSSPYALASQWVLMDASIAAYATPAARDAAVAYDLSNAVASVTLMDSIKHWGPTTMIGTYSDGTPVDLSYRMLYALARGQSATFSNFDVVATNSTILQSDNSEEQLAGDGTYTLYGMANGFVEPPTDAVPNYSFTSQVYTAESLRVRYEYLPFPPVQPDVPPPPPAPAATPEPASLALLGSGLLGACGLARRRRS